MNKSLPYIIIGGVIVVAIIWLAVASGDETEDVTEEDNNEVAEEVVKDKSSDTSMEKMEMNIVDTAINAGTFDTLVTALQTAELVDTLSGPGPFTVFAPTDDAFAKLGDDAIAELLEDKEQLTKILTYHVVSGEVPASDVVNLTRAETLQGQAVSIEITADGSVVLNGSSTVTTTDIETSNGIIHVIDTVLIPE